MTERLSRPSDAALIGRDAELAIADRALHGATGPSGPHIHISGPGGAGKSSFMRAVAARAADLYTTGVYWVSVDKLAGQSASDVASDIVFDALRSLGSGKGRTVEERRLTTSSFDSLLEAYHTFLRSANALLVFDDVVELGGVAPLTSVPPGNAVMTAGRQRWPNSDALEIALGPLSDDAALELLSRMAPRSVRSDLPLLRALARAVGNEPLGLRLAGELVRDRGAGAALRSLQGEAGRQEAVHGKAGRLRSVLLGAYGGLAPDRRRAVRLLGLLPAGPVTADALGALAGVSVADAQDTLKELAASGFIQDEGDGEYSASIAVLEFARERLNAEESVETITAVMGAMDDIAMERPGTWRDPRDRTAVQEYTLRAARSRDDQPGELGALVKLARLYALEGRFQESLAASRNAGAVAAEMGLEHLAAGPLQDEGEMLMRLGRLDEARAALERSLAIVERRPEPRFQAKTLSLLGQVYAMGGRDRDAYLAFRRALALFEQAKDGPGEAAAQRALASLSVTKGDVDAARNALRRAEEIYESDGNVLGQIAVHTALGSAHASEEDWDAAKQEFEIALELAQAVGDLSGAANAMIVLAQVHAAVGNLDLAAGHAEESLQLAIRLGDIGSEAASLAILGAVRVERAEFASAVKYLERSVSLFRELADRDGEARALQALSRAYAGEGHDAEARAALQTSAAILGAS
jgi:tetratricopeptide (TPR) repeat protein